MFLWLITAWGGSPPPGIDLDDLDHWEDRSRVLIDGPDACWSLQGRVASTVAIHSSPSLWSRGEERRLTFAGTFDGQLDRGTWTRFTYRLEQTSGDEDTDIDVPIRPTVGVLDPAVRVREPVDGEDEPDATDPGDADVPDEETRDRRSIRIGAGGGSEEAMNVIDGLLATLDSSATTSYAQWTDDPAGVALIQDLPVDDRRSAPSATIRTFFPDGGAYPTALDLTLPKRYRVGDGWIKVTLLDPQLHLRGMVVDGSVLPTLEGTSVVIGVLGFTVGYEQRLWYDQATPCQSASP